MAVNKLANLKTPKKLPSFEHAQDLANDFADYFTGKIQAISEGLQPFKSLAFDAKAVVQPLDQYLMVDGIKGG